jgi:hypothetical protein
VDKARDEIVFRQDAAIHLRRDAQLVGGQVGSVLGFALDAEQFRVGPADAEHERLAIYVHAIILVGNATAKDRGL